MAFGTPVVGTTAYSASAGTSVAPSYPAGVLATDQLVMIIGQKPGTANNGTATTPTGWTLREELTAAGGYGATLGADTGNTNLRIYTKDVVTAGLSGTVSVTLATNGVSWANITRVPTGGGAITYGSADGQRTTTPTSPLSVALTNGASATAFAAGDFAIWAMCIPTDVTTPAQFSAHTLTSSGVTFNATAELVEPDSTTGNDIGGYVAYTTVATGTGGGAPTVGATLAGTLTNVRGPIALLRMREAAPPPELIVNPGSYSITGSSADLTYSRKLALSVDPGSYALTGSSVDLTFTPAAQAFDLIVNPASYAVTGSNVTLATGRVLSVTPASYAVTGASADLTYSRKLTLEVTPSSYAITGSSVDLTYTPATAAYDLLVNPGSYAITGSSVAITASRTLSVTPGSYSNTGSNVTLTATRALSVSPGGYSITGSSVDLTYAAGNPVLTITPGSYSLTGSTVTILREFTLNVDTAWADDYYESDYMSDGHYAITGYPVRMLAPTWPAPSDVAAGVTYGPTGEEYVGTRTGGGGGVFLRRR